MRTLEWLGSLTWCSVFSLVVFMASGCQPANTTSSTNNSAGGGDAHAEPASYAEAVSSLKECRDAVKNAFAAGTPAACDAAVHEASHLLDHIPELAEKSQMSEEDTAAVKSTSDELFDLFAQIHEGVHPGGEIDAESVGFDDLSPKIDEAITALESKVSD